MPTTRARKYSGTRTSYGNTTSNWGVTRNTTKTTANVASGYKNLCSNFEQKINSFKTLCNQVKGPARAGRPTASTLNSFCNWINKGAVIQCCTPAQVSRWAVSKNKNFNPQTASPASCKNVLAAKFGKSTIKAVAKTKTGSFMVATSPTCKGKKFCFPK
jgi:hypothetical protein